MTVSPEDQSYVDTLPAEESAGTPTQTESEGSSPHPLWWQIMHAAIMLGLTAGLGWIYKRYFLMTSEPVAESWRFDVGAALVVQLYVILAFRLKPWGRESLALAVMMTAMTLARYYGEPLGALVAPVERDYWLLDPHSSRDRIVFQWLVGSPALLLAPPFLAIALWRKPLRELGIAAGEWKWWLKWLLVSSVFMLPVLWFGVVKLPELMGQQGGVPLADFYPLVRGARQSILAFLTFQAMIALLMFAWEFSLRGFLQFSLMARLGWLAIVVQNMPFVLGHVNKPESEMYGTLVSGLFLGYIAYRGRSVFPAIFIHLIVAVSNDLVVIHSSGALRAMLGV